MDTSTKYGGSCLMMGEKSAKLLGLDSGLSLFWWSLNPKNKSRCEVPPKISDAYLGKEVKYKAKLHCFHYNILNDGVFITQFIQQYPFCSPCLQGRPLKNLFFFVQDRSFCTKSGNEDVRCLRAVCPK